MTKNQRVKFLRNYLGLTQTDFGKQLGITQSWVTQLEARVDTVIEVVDLS